MEQQINQLSQYDSHLGEQDEVHQVLEKFAEAIRTGEIKKIMSFYSDNIVAYDMMPPLEFSNKASYQKSWETCFTNYFQFPVNFNYEKQKIEIAEDIAFAHSLVHMSGDDKNGEYMDAWMRNTTCLKRMNGRWLITHEHNSVPLDEMTMKGLTNLTPVEGEAPIH